MQAVYYTPRAEANVIDPAVVEVMVAAAWQQPRLSWPPIVSELLPKATVPDQRGFILGGVRL